jgi:hypothetical protein
MLTAVEQVLPESLIKMLKRVRAEFYVTVLAYPHALEPGSVLYKICDELDCRRTNDIDAKADVIIHWEDRSFRQAPAVLEERNRHQKVLNLQCKDISKRRVDKVHQAIFGYRLTIDPLRHRGRCVKKSNENATHDGTIVECPIAERDDASVYQKEVNNRIDDHSIEDIRVPVFGPVIPFCYRKRRPIVSRFSNENTSASLCEVKTVLSDGEVQQILAFSDAMGLDYGELDVLRDKDDGRLYVVDVNNTPWGPPNHLDRASLPAALQRLSQAFVSAFLQPNRLDTWPRRILSRSRTAPGPVPDTHPRN